MRVLLYTSGENKTNGERERIAGLIDRVSANTACGRRKYRLAQFFVGSKGEAATSTPPGTGLASSGYAAKFLKRERERGCSYILTYDWRRRLAKPCLSDSRRSPRLTSSSYANSSVIMRGRATITYISAKFFLSRSLASKSIAQLIALRFQCPFRLSARIRDLFQLLPMSSDSENYQ